MALWYGNWSTHVVQEASSRSDIDEFYSSDSSHFNVCKPRDQTDSGFYMLIELIGSHMSTISSKPTTQIRENTDKECNGLLTNLLKNLGELDMGQAFLLKRDDLKKIMNSPKLLDNLRDSLKDAGLELTSKDDNFEYWEPADNKGETNDTQEHSPNQK